MFCGDLSFNTKKKSKIVLSISHLDTKNINNNRVHNHIINDRNSSHLPGILKSSGTVHTTSLSLTENGNVGQAETSA